MSSWYRIFWLSSEFGESMNNLNWEFFEAYKSLDELCKQILSSDRGISEYINEMSNENQGRWRVTCWEKDYKQLKRMRWIRNQLAHESGSFQDNLVTAEDIEWLKNFRSRIMNSTDPFSLLYKSNKSESETKAVSEQNNQTESCNEESETPLIYRLVAWLVILIGFILIMGGLYFLCFIAFLKL